MLAQSTISKYLDWPEKPSSQTWKTFIPNCAEVIAAIDMSVVPMLTFEQQYAFLIVGLQGIEWAILHGHSGGSMQERTLRRRYSSSRNP